MSDRPTSYERIDAVETRDASGIEVTVALQVRSSLRESISWYTVSWRTRLYPGGPNRRFYVHKGRPWTIEATTAVSLLEDFERVGGLDEAYFDSRRRPSSEVVVSADLGAADRTRIMEEITMPSEDWGDEPFWVVLQEPFRPKFFGAWRKIMIVDPVTGLATFRSTTTETSYKPRAVLRDGCEWYLDNSMQDASVQQTREFLSRLREVVTHR